MKQYSIEVCDNGQMLLKVRYCEKFFVFKKWTKWFYFEETKGNPKKFETLSDVADAMKIDFIGTKITIEDN